VDSAAAIAIALRPTEEASMYRQRRNKLRRRRRAVVVASFAAVLGLLVVIPTVASADPVGDLLNGLTGSTGGGATGSGGAGTTSAPAPKAGNPPTYTPPLHGTNPHGEGNTAVLDLAPSTTDPLSGDPSKTGEELVVGDTRGEQTSSGYSGSSTLLYLLGTPIIQVQSQAGESNDGPLQPLQDGLNQLCDASGNQLCLNVLEMHSASTTNSSTNSLEVLGAHLGGPSGINADVAQNNGNISDDGNCQTAHGSSNAASLSIGGQPVADALQGTSDSTACNDGSQSSSNSSNVLKLGGTGLPIPTGGCDNGTANSNFTPLSPLLAAVCNADDTNGSQTGSPYGVREALTLMALVSGNSSLLKVATAGPETHAVAPGGPTTVVTPPSGPTGPTGGTQGAGGKGGNQGGNGAGNNGGNGGGGAGNGAAANNAAAGNGQLAFTGADLLALGLVGGALILGGLALTTAGRRHRQTV
jgi:hypothetical protein